MFENSQKKKCEALLDKGLAKMEIVASDLQHQQILGYIALLHKWNSAFNLTAVREPTEMVRRHILDSLSINPYLHGDRIIDVGTGAGLPGIPLSIFHPDKNFFLLDSNQKKQIFVLQATKSLSLPNVQCIHSKVEAYQPAQKFSTIVTRAFASITDMVNLTTHLLADGGQFLAMMGKIPEEVQLPTGYQIDRLVSLNVPGEEAQRHLAIVTALKNKNHKEL